VQVIEEHPDDIVDNSESGVEIDDSGKNVKAKRRYVTRQGSAMSQTLPEEDGTTHV
jgi:hypothetical protein